MPFADVLDGRSPYALHHGDGIAWLDSLPEGSIDAVVCDPPYAEVSRSYGRMTEPEWDVFARDLVRSSLRVLTPRGSMLLILQPNSLRVGRMRGWFYRFLAWCADDLPRETDGRSGIVQDAWWWNIAAAPTVHCHRGTGLMRPSVKACVWIGPEDCYRDQGAVLWQESDASVALRASGRAGGRVLRPSTQSFDLQRSVALSGERGGSTPFNILPLANTNSADSAGSEGHGAGTPYALAAWWVRYLCPPGGIVADPCGGTHTMGLAAVRQGRRYLGCERDADHHARGVRRMATCSLDTGGSIAADDAPDWGPMFGGGR